MNPSAGQEGEVPPERALLLNAVRVDRDPERAERDRAFLRRDLDWTYLRREASRHGLGPLLYRHLQGLGPETLPPELQQGLRTQCHYSAVRNLYLASELLHILRLLEANGIPAIPFKGPTLALLAYGSLSLREFSDLDILVPQRDVLKTRQLLGGQGFRPLHALSESQAAAYLRFQREYLVERPREQVCVDVHWRVLPKYLCRPGHFEHLWQQLRPVTLLGRPVPTFGVEDLLLLLCVHGLQHRWGALLWIGDVAHLIHAHPALNWERVVTLAGRLDIERMLHLGLFLASASLGATLPDDLGRTAGGDPVVKALATQVQQSLFQEQRRSDKALADAFFHLRGMQRTGQRVRYCAYLALNPTMAEWTWLPLPSPLASLYFLLRPVRLTGKYGRQLWHRLLGRTAGAG
jgi:hypothetical protein